MKTKLILLIATLFPLTACGHPYGVIQPIPIQYPGQMAVRMECDPAEDCFVQARQAYLNGDLQGAVAGLQELLIQDPGLLWKGRASLLLARSLAASGDPTAVSHYEAAAETLPELGDYIYFSLGQFYLIQGEALKAAEVFDNLHKRYPDSLLRSQAIFQAAEAYAQTGRNTSAIASFETFLSLYPEDPKAATALYQMAQAYLKDHQAARAVELFKRVLWQFPQEPVASSARTELDNLAAQGVMVPPFTSEEKFQQAKALYRATRYLEAARTFQETLALSLPSAIQTEAKLYLGISLVQLRQWSEAMKVFDILLKNRPGSDVAGEALSWFGRAALRQGDLDKLQWVHETLKTRYPDRAERAKALWYLVSYYESKNQDQKAIQACRELIESFPQDSLAQEAYWRIGWIHYKKGRMQEALKVFDELLGQYANTAFRPQVLYWKARLLERSGDSEKAQEVYRHLCQDHARSYYCHRTRSRLGNDLLQWQVSRGSVSITGGRMEASWWDEKSEVLTPQILNGDPQYKRARELMLVAFSEEAVRELNTLVSRYAPNRKVLLFLADQLYTLGAYDQSLRIIRLYFQETLEKGVPPMPNRFWEQAYPLGMMDRIVKLLDSDRLDPYVVASIIREESMYDPKAVSRAGAVGLMQVLPETGRWVAGRLGLKEFEPDRLFDPELNIKLGAWYLTHLLEQFKGNLVFTIAAYNAGPEAVTEWVQRGNDQDMDEFIEQIPFSETRLYVKRVLRSYYEYVIMNMCLYNPLPPPLFLDKGSCPEYS